MDSISGTKETKSEIGTTRLEPWLHKGVTVLADFQNTSVSAKIARYVEEGFRREMESTDFEAIIAENNAQFEENARKFREAHAAATAMPPRREKAKVSKNN